MHVGIILHMKRKRTTDIVNKQYVTYNVECQNENIKQYSMLTTKLYRLLTLRCLQFMALVQTK